MPEPGKKTPSKPYAELLRAIRNVKSGTCGIRRGTAFVVSRVAGDRYAAIVARYPSATLWLRERGGKAVADFGTLGAMVAFGDAIRKPFRFRKAWRGKLGARRAPVRLVIIED